MSRSSAAVDHDVIIVGGGPAGLNAALVLGRSRRGVLLIDAGEPRNRASGHVQGYLGHDGTTPAELRERGRAEVARYGVELAEGRVVRLLPAPTEDRVEVTMHDGAVRTARRVLVATGLRDELPDIPGLADRWGRDVLHCPYCHGWEVRDAVLAVVATTDDEVDKALTMTQWSPDVRLVLHGVEPDDLPQALCRRLAALGVETLPGPIDRVVVEDDRITALRMADGTAVACDAVVVQPRLAAQDDLLVSVGVTVEAGEFGEFVVSDETGATGVPGIWVAGNVSDPQAQVVMAAAAGYRAALAIDHDLIEEDVETAVRRSAP